MSVPDLPIEILKVDHVSMASWDASGPARLLTEVLGATFLDGGDNRTAGYRWLQFLLPGGKIEIIEPLHRDGFLYRFLTRRGEGLHHVTLFVADLPDALSGLEAAGYTPVDVDLRHDDWKEAFLHPKEAFGVLIQLAQSTEDDEGREPSRPLEEFLADRPDLRPA